jgi:hypothetical protein
MLRLHAACACRPLRRLCAACFSQPARCTALAPVAPILLSIEPLRFAASCGAGLEELGWSGGNDIWSSDRGRSGRGRKARLMEVDPKYADCIMRRWQEYTGKEAVLGKTGPIIHRGGSVFAGLDRWRTSAGNATRSKSICVPRARQWMVISLIIIPFFGRRWLHFPRKFEREPRTSLTGLGQRAPRHPCSQPSLQALISESSGGLAPPFPKPLYSLQA